MTAMHERLPDGSRVGDDEEIPMPFGLLFRMEMAREAATAAALSRRVNIDDEAINALAAKHGLNPDDIKEQTAYQLMQDLVFPIMTEKFRRSMRTQFVAIATFVAGDMAEQRDRTARQHASDH